jgi:MFS family permease
MPIRPAGNALHQKPLDLAWWELLLAVPVGLTVLVFVLAGRFVSALVVAAVLVLLIAWRAQVVERNLPGGYTRVRGWVLIAQWCAMAAIYAVIIGIQVVAYFERWAETRVGMVAVYASGGLAVFLGRELYVRGDRAIDHLIGSDAEIRVAEVLDRFRDRGWDVIHDVKKDDGGNVDHLVLGPSVAFAVETKSGRDSSRARGQALGNAAWAKAKYGRRWVNAVVCVLTDPPAAPKKIGKAWVTGIADLESLLNRPSRLL